MDEGDEMGDEENERLVRDVEMIEEVIEEEIKEVSKLVKPVHQVLFKVGTRLFSHLVQYLPWGPGSLGVFDSVFPPSVTSVLM